MKIADTGWSGLIGAALIPHFGLEGYEALPVRRSAVANGNTAIRCNPGAGILDTSILNGVGAVIHLAGENIVGRWTPAKKNRVETRFPFRRPDPESATRQLPGSPALEGPR